MQRIEPAAATRPSSIVRGRQGVSSRPSQHTSVAVLFAGVMPLVAYANERDDAEVWRNDTLLSEDPSSAAIFNLPGLRAVGLSQTHQRTVT
jgi:hypothetical protein